MNTPTNAINTGIKKATEAAKAINAKLAIPQFKNTETKPTDFNDLARLEGLSVVHKQLANAKQVETNSTDEAEKKSSQVAKIIALTNDLELFHDKQNITYATLKNNDHYETWRLDSTDFQNWLKYEFWKKNRAGISGNTLQDALGILQGKASFEGDCKEVYIRVASVNDAIYIDLVNKQWEVIKVTQSGWEIIKVSPVKFIRLNNMQALPIPIKEGNIENIWQYLNFPLRYRKLVLAFMLECFRPNTPFPILVLYGTAGSSKSTTQTIVRMLIDPSACNLRTAPKKKEDLLVAAANNWIVSFNNVSYLSDEQQDDLCCVSTGSALATRKFYTTHEEACTNIKRPVIVNGISDLITAQDLIDRCIIVDLPEITQENCKSEEEIMAGFGKDYSAIFGALLYILAKTLQTLPTVNLKNKPRMADFAVLGCTLEKAMGWEEGSFMEAYVNNRNESMANALEHSPVAVALANYINEIVSYEGNYSQLYHVLTRKYKPDMVGWPMSEKGLASKIKRQKQALRSIGIEVIFDDQRHNDGFHVSIQKVVNNVHDVHEVHQIMADAPF